MNELVIFTGDRLPKLIAAGDQRTRVRFIEFFSVSIRNPHTRRSYVKAILQFLEWCAQSKMNIASITDVQPVHIAAYIEQVTRSRAAPTAKARLAALRRLFDWLVVGQIVATNPAAAVRGPAHSVKKGKTPVLSAEEARQLLDTIDTSTPTGLRDRALIALMVYSLARIGAAVTMNVEDVFVQRRRLWVRLHEKGGKEHEMPCHHNLEPYLHDYIEQTGLRAEPKEPLFRTINRQGRGPPVLSARRLTQQDAHAMVRRRAAAAGIGTLVCNHSFRATGITVYLKNGGKLENAAGMANHASTRTTQLYDRRADDVTLDEVEKISI